MVREGLPVPASTVTPTGLGGRLPWRHDHAIHPSRPAAGPHPVVTYAVSGLGDAAREYADACPGAGIGEALAVRGEQVAQAADDLDRWLASTGLVTG